MDLVEKAEDLLARGWNKVRGLAGLTQIALLVGVIALGLFALSYFTNVVGGAVDWARAVIFDAHDAALKGEVDEIKTRMLQRDQELIEKDQNIAVLKAQKEAQKAALVELGLDEEKIDAVLTDDYAALEAARTGGAGGPVDSDDLLRELRAAYPRNRPARRVR